MHLNFTYRNKIEGCLSNMSNHPVKLGSNVFSMGEAAFHYAKYASIANDASTKPERKKQLLAHADKFLVAGGTGPAYKTLGGKSKNGFALEPAELAIWSGVCDKVQLDICQYKVQTYKEIADVLRKTAGIVLIHSCRTADDKMKQEHWCGRAKDDGTVLGGNMLGRIWMSIRDG